MTGDQTWAFAAAFYALPRMSARLLAMQEKHGIDIALVLVLLDAGRRGVQLETATVKALWWTAEDWQCEVVKPLRYARRSLGKKIGDPEVALREQIRNAELAAEELIIRKLATELAIAGNVPAPEAAYANLENYCHLLELPMSEFDTVVAAFAEGVH